VFAAFSREGAAMPETVPRWLLAGAGIVALITILVGVKDYAERKSAGNPPSGTGSPSVVHSDVKSIPKANVKRKGPRPPATGVNDYAAESPSADALEKFPTMGGIVQAGARIPLATDDGVKRGELEPIQSQRKAGPARCSPLPNSTKPEDVDARYYQNWAREYGCGVD